VQPVRRRGVNEARGVSVGWESVRSDEETLHYLPTPHPFTGSRTLENTYN
jgi:hypothetical protein